MLLSIKKYVRAENLEQAYELCQGKHNVVLGGMLWLKMQNKNVDTAIDLCDLGLNRIEETETEYKIGAMVSLRDLEMHAGLNLLTQGACEESLKHIVGVQFRNTATVGGSVFGRYGFSDVLTILMALDAEVELYKAGRIAIGEFAKMPKQRDILVNVYVPKTMRKVVYMSQRNTSTDFPVITCAVSECNGKRMYVVGARPGKAKAFENIEDIDGFGTNLRASAEYRKRVCEVLVRRAVEKLENGYGN